MDLTTAQKHSRFCFIGSLDPVAIYRKGEIDVGKYLPILQELYALIDFVPFIKHIKEAMNLKPHPRYEEPLFALAVFLTTATTKHNMRSSVIRVFPNLVETDEQLFLFLKIVKMILTYKNLKSFPKAVQKSVKKWYQKQSLEKLADMWIRNKSAHTFNHRNVFKIFHVDRRAVFDKVNTLYRYYVIRKYSANNATEQVNSVSVDKKVNSQKNDKSKGATKKLTTPSNGVGVASGAAVSQKKVLTKQSDLVTMCAEHPEIVYEKMLQLADKDLEVADILQIIREYKLNHKQIPFNISKKASVVREVLPTMSYLDLLNLYCRFFRYKYYQNTRLYKMYCKQMQDMNLLSKSDISTVNILMAFDKLNSIYQIEAQVLHMISFKKIANMALGKDQPKNIRMCIALNLQDFYRKKKLLNHNSVNYFDAAITMTYGFVKRETNVKVLLWTEETPEVTPFPMCKSMDLETVLTFTKSTINNLKNKQNVRSVLNYALKEKEAYDVFLCVGPSFRKSNPSHNSEAINATFIEYRNKVHPKAKLVLLSLMEFKKPSMTYKSERNDHILEILGLDESTVQLIDSFATEKFY